MFCPRCGTENPNGATFCKNCGASLSRETPIVQQQGGVAAAAAAMPRQKSKKPLIIAIAAVAVIAVVVIACILFLPKGCYVKTSTFMQVSENLVYEMTWEYADNGSITSYNITSDGETTTTREKELVDGIAIPENATGTYQMNSDGYVSSYEYTDLDTGLKYSTSYEYHKPGIIKTKITRNSTFTRTVTFDEDGWIISEVMKYTNPSQSSRDYEIYCKYEFTNENKVLCYSYNDASLTGDSICTTLELDDHGNIISTRSASGDTHNGFTYKKIDAPAKMVTATARLKSE